MNDFQRLEDTFRRHGDQLAAMLIEPLQGNCCGIKAQVAAREEVMPTAL